MTFKQYLQEGGGESAGKMELVKTPVKEARAFAEDIYKKNNRELDKEIPNFDQNYIKVQKSAKEYGKTKRKDMPVINDQDVKAFQKRLSEGFIDVNAPHNPTFKDNPFPEGLSGDKAKEWLKSGLPIYDKGKKTDDIVKVSKKSQKISNLKPIQQQIYFDKSIKACAEFGTDKTVDFLGSTNFIVSSDYRIIDGHHRALSGNLIDPNLQVECIVIDLPMDKMLPMTKAYGDAIGNKRNA